MSKSPKVRVLSEAIGGNRRGFQSGVVVRPHQDAPECDKWFFRFKEKDTKKSTTFFVTRDELEVMAFVCLGAIIQKEAK